MRTRRCTPGGLPGEAIERSLPGSLDRLGMEPVDLHQTHRWDSRTATETTVRTLDDAVCRGQARHVGVSSMWAYGFADALATSDRLGRERFATMHNHYNRC